jgi:DNA-directed RNA polymerase specialized sigma subunit
MKIALNMGQSVQPTSKDASDRALERDILAAKKGDWNAKHNLARTFTPLLTSLAEKRTNDVSNLNAYIDAGKQGLFKAAGKYKPSIGPDKFRIFALDFIETAMARVDRGGGFWSRLFGR